MFKYYVSKLVGKVTNKLGLSCAKLRSVELKFEDNKIWGLNEIRMRNIKGKKLRDDKSVVGHNFGLSLANRVPPIPGIGIGIGMIPIPIPVSVSVSVSVWQSQYRYRYRYESSA